MWQIWKSSINLTHNQITSCHSTVIVFVCLFVTHVQRGWYGFYFALTRYAELPRVVRVAQMLTDPGERKKVCSFIHICLTLQCPNANYLLNGSCLLVLNLWTVTLRYEQSCKDSWRDAWCTTRDTCVSLRHVIFLTSYLWHSFVLSGHYFPVLLYHDVPSLSRAYSNRSVHQLSGEAPAVSCYSR